MKTRWAIAVLFIQLLLLAATPHTAGAGTGVLGKIADPPAPSRWMSPLGLPKPDHEPPLPAGPLSVVRVSETTGERPLVSMPPERGRICLAVEASIFEAIRPQLTTYQQDLERDGYEVIVVEFESGTAEQLRSLLASMYAEASSLIGAVLIGRIPYIIYEMMQEFSGDPVEYEDFPCDLFYMDLDGGWRDVLEDGDVHAGNGKLDTRFGDLGLEIWVARLKADTLPGLGDEVSLLETYFAKNHAYREGRLHADCRALVYPDDAWTHRGYEDTASIKRNYGSPGTHLILDPNSTTAADYLGRIQERYELIHTRAHGYAGGHKYYRNDGLMSDWVYTSDYAILDPPALFYSFYVCSGADYTRLDYLTGTAVFNHDSGLVAWGSTKSGGMYEDDPFYVSLAAGGSFGEAFLTWYNTIASRYPERTPRWWYGMGLTGDASLSLSKFSDVPRFYWAFHEVGACNGAGIVAGYPDGNYRPTLAVTRDQMALFVARALAGGEDNVPEGPAEATFDDVPDIYWAYDHVEYCYDENVVQGYTATTYAPTAQVTRDQMAVYVARALVAPTGEAALADYVPADPRDFPDVPDTFWAWKHIEYCAEQGVVGGYGDGYYRPEWVVTRDQMAVYVARAFDLLD